MQNRQLPFFPFLFFFFSSSSSSSSFFFFFFFCIVLFVEINNQCLSVAKLDSTLSAAILCPAVCVNDVVIKAGIKCPKCHEATCDVFLLSVGKERTNISMCIHLGSSNKKIHVYNYS